MKLPPNEISQIAFLRAKVYESEGAKDKALEDYYRSFTLAYGNDILLSKLSMGGAMLIQKDDPRIAEKNQNALNQMQSIAYFFGRRFGKESMPAQFQAFAVKPVLPKQAPPARRRRRSARRRGHARRRSHARRRQRKGSGTRRARGSGRCPESRRQGGRRRQGEVNQASVAERDGRRGRPPFPWFTLRPIPFPSASAASCGARCRGVWRPRCGDPRCARGQGG